MKLPIAVALVASILATEAQAADRLTIKVVSGRADLVSAGDALLRVGGVSSTDGLSVKVGKRDRSAAFAVAADGTVQGLVSGLRRGKNFVLARQGGRAARLVVTNHPKGGPLFSGPQLQPWVCQETAKDAQCNQPAEFSFVYMPADGGGFEPYDPANPPDDVGTTTTDEDVTVPFIVRLETGYMNRDQYKVAALFQPDKPWTGTAPQEQFNHKLLLTHGAGCGADHKVGSAPGVTEGASQTALGRGFIVASHALDNAGHNCHLPSEAESLVMTKEHITERYGPLRYTIGTGCSGGSLTQQWVANAYPGIYQGILPTCSFPDAWGTATQFLDYHQTLRYFKDPSTWGPGVVWTPQQMAQVQGHISIANSQVSDTAQFHVVVPTDPCSGVTDEERYHPDTNPGGVRCTIQDASINVFGPRPEAWWSPQEKEIGRGFAGVPIDNVGVEYGLHALRRAEITPAQFVDLNQKIGAVSLVNAEHTAERMTADERTLARAYRSGMINEANNLDRTAIIDCRGPDPGAFHDSYRAFAMRARLDREHGDHDNQAIWEGPVLIVGDSQCEVNSFLAMDRWLTAVEQDKAKGPMGEKVARNKPADITDRCYDGNGGKVADGLCPDAVVPVYGTPRTVAGEAITTDGNKCRLKPLDRNADYGPLPFSDAQWAELQKLFPDGVCDFDKPGVQQQGTIPWLTYQDARGNVVTGGRTMGAAPRSRAVKVKRR